MDPLIAESYKNMKEKEDTQAAEFIKDVFENGTKALTDTIPKKISIPFIYKMSGNLLVNS